MEGSVLERIRALDGEFDAALAGASNADALEEVRVRFLSRKGEITQIMRGLGGLPPDERREVGRRANALRERSRIELDAALAALSGPQDTTRGEDLTLPGRRPASGGLHPVRQVELQLVEVFRGLGFDVALGPDIELDHYNFRCLNFPDDHPARDMHDTFYVTEDVVMRTHTSPVQVRTMEKVQPPVRVVTPGRVYRSETIDATHAAVFHQLEGLYVDQRVTMADLKGTLAGFARALFGDRTRVRFRPDFFPFTEPSVEFSFYTEATGWLEIGGAGMVDPEVFRSVDYDPEKWSGFAFGLGVERIAMLLYGITDIRTFFENDLRVLRQTW